MMDGLLIAIVLGLFFFFGKPCLHEALIHFLMKEDK